VIWRLDRDVVSLVWSPRGYPARSPYRDSHRLTANHHHVWRNDGDIYDKRAAMVQVRADARDFVARARRRVSEGGVCVCALDTELLGHWWHEGVEWLLAVLEEASSQGLALTNLDDALEWQQPGELPRELAAGDDSAGVVTWGEGGDLRTWSGPDVADLAWRVRAAELRVMAARRPSPRTVRELLALQASDWLFLTHHRLAGDYPRERIEAHERSLERALGGDPELAPELRNLAPDLVPWPG
jgi:1,4-alpha-glucan branching enzyme